LSSPGKFAEAGELGGSAGSLVWGWLAGGWWWWLCALAWCCAGCEKVLPSAVEKLGETFEQLWFWNSGRVGRAVEQHPGEEQPKFPSPFMVETVVDGG
jgi:hypothetical protein